MRHSLDRLAALPQPVIAALNGDAYGGGAEIAVACDFRIAADDAKIGFTQVRLAIMPAWGGIERLATIVGRAKALYLLETGSVLDAPQAMTWGLVEEVVPRAGFADRWRQLAQEMAQTPREALIGIKAALDSVKVHPSAADAATATEAFAQAWAAPAHWAAADDLARRRREARNR
jgi:enoyl-CoA hydratase/carnithine racemase